MSDTYAYSWDEDFWQADTNESQDKKSTLFDDIGGFIGDITKTLVGGYAAVKVAESSTQPLPSSVGVTEPVNQPVNNQTPAATATTTQPQILGMDQQTALIAGGLLLVVVLVLARGK